MLLIFLNFYFLRVFILKSGDQCELGDIGISPNRPPWLMTPYLAWLHYHFSDPLNLVLTIHATTLQPVRELCAITGVRITVSLVHLCNPLAMPDFSGVNRRCNLWLRSP